MSEPMLVGFAIVLAVMAILAIVLLVCAFRDEVWRICVLIKAALTWNHVTFFRYYTGKDPAAGPPEKVQNPEQERDDSNSLNEEGAYYEPEPTMAKEDDGRTVPTNRMSGVLDLGELWQLLFNHLLFIKIWLSMVLSFVLPAAFIGCSLYYESAILLGGVFLSMLLNLLVLDFERLHRTTFVGTYMLLNAIVKSERDKRQARGSYEAEGMQLRPSDRLAEDFERARAA